MADSPVSDDEVLRYAASLGLTPSAVFSRTSVQEVECRRCRAHPGHSCSDGKGGLRRSNHLERCFDRIRSYLEKAPRG